MQKNKSKIPDFFYDGLSCNLNSILRVEYSNGNTFIFFTDGTKSHSIASIDELEWDLPKNMFTRVHPNHLVNNMHKKKVVDVTTPWLEMDNGHLVPLSDNLVPPKKNRFKKILKHLSCLLGKFWCR